MIKYAFFVFLLSYAKADVSELKHHQPSVNRSNHDFSKELDLDVKTLEDIKFSLQIILRELGRLQTIPQFQLLQSNLINQNDVKIREMVSTVEQKLSELGAVSTEMETISMIPTPPQLQLAPPKTIFSTVLDNYWLDGSQPIPDASQRVVVSISPVLKTTRQRRGLLKAENDITNGIFKRIIARRAIPQNGYSYEFPQGTALEKDYLPPLSSNVNSLQQTYSEENGYDYKKPEKLFEFPTTTEAILGASETKDDTKYLPPVENVDPTFEASVSIESETKENNKYLPPEENLDPAQTNIDEGYAYPRPEVSFPSASNVITTTVQPITTSTEKVTTTTEKNKEIPLDESNSDGGPLITTIFDNGYDYPKPDVPLEGSNTDQVINYPEQPYSPEDGYDYSRPTIQFDERKDYLPPTRVMNNLNPLNRLSKDLKELTQNQFRY